jgi:hypothetical protein
MVSVTSTQTDARVKRASIKVFMNNLDARV